MHNGLPVRNNGPYTKMLRLLSYAPAKGKYDFIHYRCKDPKMSLGNTAYYKSVQERWHSEDPGMPMEGFMGALDCVLTHMLGALKTEKIVVDLKWEEGVITAFTVPANQRTAFRTAFIDFIGNQQHFVDDAYYFTNGDEWICQLLNQSPYGINMYVTFPSSVSAQLGKILADKNSELTFTRYFSNPRATSKGNNYLEWVVSHGNAGNSFDPYVTENTSVRVQEAGEAVRKRIYGDLDAGYIGLPD
jgi:hypothetical protein